MINIIDKEYARLMTVLDTVYVIFLFYVNFDNVRARNMMKKRRSTAKFVLNRVRDNARPSSSRRLIFIVREKEGDYDDYSQRGEHYTTAIR